MAKKKETMENKRKVIASAKIEDKSQPDKPSEEKDSSVEEPEIQKDWPSWMQMVLEGLGAEKPVSINRASDEEMLAIKGVGPATLEEIHAWMDEHYSQPKKKPKKARIRVRPMRGVGGVGQAGTEAEIDREYAEELEADGYVEILE